MSDSKREEQGQVQQNNPFSEYIGKGTSEDRQPEKKKARSKSSQKNSVSSRSRSRQGRGREKKNSQERDYQSKQMDRSGRERGDRGPVVMKRDETTKEQAYYKTKLCPLYEKNACTKGSGCNFAHGEKELRGLPNFRKTRLCIPFKNGECPKASSDCKYAHGEGQLKKLAYDYYPQQRGSSPVPPRGERYDRDRERHRHHHKERERDRREDRHYRDRRSNSRERYYRERERRHHHHVDDREYERGRGSSGYNPYAANYNNPYLLAPSGGYGEMYPSHGSSGNGGSNASSFGGYGGSYPPPSSLYNMGPNYDYSYGNYGYPPYGSSSV